MSFSFRAGWQIEQVESGGGENNRPTDQLLFRPGYTQRTGRARFFFIYNTCMYKFCICMFYCYITRFPDGQCREKLRGAKIRGLSDVIYRRNRWGEQRGGTQCLDLNIVADQPRSDWEEETERRESRGLREDQQEQLVHKVSFFFFSPSSSSRGPLLCWLRWGGWLESSCPSLPSFSPKLKWSISGGVTGPHCSRQEDRRFYSAQDRTDCEEFKKKKKAFWGQIQDGSVKIRFSSWKARSTAT